jgi:hypothetical protein
MVQLNGLSVRAAGGVVASSVSLECDEALQLAQPKAGTFFCVFQC